MNHGTAFYHDERCLWHTTGESVMGACHWAAGCSPGGRAATRNIHTMPYGSRISMRLPNAAHESRPWRIREIAPDFTLEDVWALPVHGGAEDFQTLLEVGVSLDMAKAGSLPARVLWRLRDRLGSWFGLGRISASINRGRDDAAGKLPIPGTNETSLIDRLPDDLRNTAADPDFGWTPLAPLYRTDVEFAAEMSNRTVHSVMHLAWVDRGEGRYQGQMAVYVKPRGLLGKGYMALIKPFRYWVVYPALMREIERAWNRRVPRRSELDGALHARDDVWHVRGPRCLASLASHHPAIEATDEGRINYHG